MSSEEASSTSYTKPSSFIVVSSDGQPFELDLKLAEQSETLSRLIENFDYSRDDVRQMPVPLGNIKKEQLEKIIVWLKRHQSHSSWVPRDKQCVPDYRFGQWSTNYFDIPNSQLFELMIAANYLCIPRLYDALGRVIASKITGKTAEGMCIAFNLNGNSIKPKTSKTSDEQNHSSKRVSRASSHECPEKRLKTDSPQLE